MKANAIKCNSCGDTIYSRSQHDCRSCSCWTDKADNKGCYVDGGQAPDGIMRMGGHANSYVMLTVDLGDEVTPKVLYNDWNQRKDIYGLIKAFSDDRGAL